MIAHFYIMAESFVNNAAYSLHVIEDKIKRLAEDVQLINQYKDENKVYTNYTDLYPQLFYGGYTVGDFICEPTKLKEEGVDRDVINAMFKVIEKSEETSLTSAEVISELLNWNDDNNAHGLIAFHNVGSLSPESQVVYGVDSWYKFKRYFLGEFPKDEKYFLGQCEKYFPRLTFHEDNIVSLCAIFPDFSKSVVKHLSHLNDVFYTYKHKSFANESEKYKLFSAECSLDEDAAPKDSNSAKEKLTYIFKDNKGGDKKVSCYPHLRLCKSDKAGDTKYYYNRIYFHEGFADVAKGNILIGHIGKHRD